MITEFTYLSLSKPLENFQEFAISFESCQKLHIYGTYVIILLHLSHLNQIDIVLQIFFVKRAISLLIN